MTRSLFFGHPQGMPLLLLFVIALVAFSCDLEDPSTPGLLVPRTVDQDPTLPSLAINGTLLHVETYGKPSDPLLVLIHGGPGGDYRSLIPAKAMAPEGFFVIFYDQRGTGLSQRVSRSQFEGADAIQLMIDDLDQLIGHFKKSPSQKVFLMGHSWGAMLATAYLNQNPQAISGAVLAEPGGFTWTQTTEYLSRSNKIKLFSEALNDAVYPEQIFSGRAEHEILDYKASFFASFENAPGNTIGNAGPYPFWRNGAVVFNALIDNAERRGLDFTTHLKEFKPKVLFLYSELNRAYQLPWAQQVSSPYAQAQLEEIKGCGHEMFHFAWPGIMEKSLSYLNALK
ncbi:alpha/beta fold hydrolase [Haliscomenobacter sp.]|uniref:alpha/beta fold hydrolase n=1 Tax=Haliscomenobacter sp. TaxID=2717303 RepID=UPI0035934824